MFRLVIVLFRLRFFSPKALFWLIASLYQYGTNLMSLLSFAERTYGDRIVLVDEEQTLTFRQLLTDSVALAAALNQHYHVKSGQRVGLMCKNHVSLVKSIFACSRLGADIYLLNAEMGKTQFTSLLDQYKFDLLIYDPVLLPLIEQSSYANPKLLSYHASLQAINNLKAGEITPLPKCSRNKIVILTGGTTGKSKAAEHQASLLNFLDPLIALVTRLNLTKNQTAYIATPIYHGYGIALLIVFVLLGNKIILRKGYDVNKASSLIKEYNVEIVILVPLMLHRMLSTCPEDLGSLACIVSGSAELNPKLVHHTLRRLGDVLFNLYGTSEAGLLTIATPGDLRQSPNTIGKAIKGARFKVIDEQEVVLNGSTGRLFVKNSWSMKNNNTSWIDTGDLGYRDDNGLYFLCGRADDMVVSAGVNVYPLELEQVLITHPKVKDVAVIGVRDEEFGQRLKALVLPIEGTDISDGELKEWLSTRVARFQQPREIVFVKSMPYTTLGKLDRKQLKRQGE